MNFFVRKAVKIREKRRNKEKIRENIINCFCSKRCNGLFGQGYILMHNCVLINHASHYLFIMRDVCTNILHIYCVIISIEIHRELERVVDHRVSQYKRFYRSR